MWTWTFGKRIAAGFTVAFMLLVTIGTIAYRNLDVLTKTSYLVAHTHVVLDHVGGTLNALKDAETGQRGFVITGEDVYLDPYHTGVSDVGKHVAELRRLTVDNPTQVQRVAQLETLVAARLLELERPIEARRTEGLEAAKEIVQTRTGKRIMDDLRRTLDALESDERKLLEARAADVENAASTARTSIFAGTVICLLLVTAIGTWLTRSLNSQIGDAVHDVQRSSTELQSAANQQATGAKESATSMNEITTTINELLATSRQIAESARHVVQIAEQTATAARAGGAVVERADESFADIRKRVDAIVSHMLELGKKSQHIGAVLDIVFELAEQTNILAINATIEAAGAGETGRRFAVVADEIRKLADRVTASTKEIRTLIEDIRGAVNTTVMTTEMGSKTVESGSQQFAEVTTAFKDIARLVTTTTQAAREIELSTKQQTTAVEQVNMAIENVAQATRETEASSGQTLQAASQLTHVAKDLSRLVQPPATA